MPISPMDKSFPSTVAPLEKEPNKLFHFLRIERAEPISG
jgi:hypothetical protein